MDPRKPGKYSYSGLDICFLFEPFYIGKGTGDRMFKHLKWASENMIKNNLTDIMRNKIVKIISSGRLPYVDKISQEIDSSEKAINLEYLIIGSIKNFRCGGPLLNIHLTDRCYPGHTEETRKKISESNSGRKRKEADRNEISKRVSGLNNPMYGKKHTDSSIQKMKLNKKPHRWSEEEKKKMSNERTGKSYHSKDQIFKISEFMKSREVSVETRKKISDSRSGKELSIDTRNKMSETRRGIKRGFYRGIEKIYKIDGNNNTILEYNNRSELENCIGKFSLSRIINAFLSNKTYKNFKWDIKYEQ
jgi:hypothetical protein